MDVRRRGGYQGVRETASYTSATVRPDARTSALRVSDFEKALQPIHAGDGGRGLWGTCEPVSESGRGTLPQFGPRAYGRLYLRSRLDAAFGRCAVHSRGGHRTDAAW